MDTAYLIIGVVIIFLLIYLYKSYTSPGGDNDDSLRQQFAIIAENKKEIAKLLADIMGLNKALAQYKLKDLANADVIQKLNAELANYRMSTVSIQERVKKETEALSSILRACEANMSTLEKTNNLWVSRFNDANAYAGELLKYKNQYEARESDLTALSQKIRQYEDDINYLHAQINAGVQSLTDTGIEKIKNELTQCQNDALKTSSRVAGLQNTISVHDLQTGELQQKIIEQDKSLTALRDILNTTTEQKNNYIKLYNELNIKYNNDMGDAFNLTVSRDYYKTEYEKSEEKYYELKTSTDELKNTINTQLNQIQQDKINLQIYQTQIMELQTQLADLRSNTVDSDTQIKNLTNAVEYFQQQVASEKNKNVELQNQLTIARQQLANIKTNITQITNLITARFEYDPLLDKLLNVQNAMKQYADKGQLSTCVLIKQKIMDMVKITETYADADKCNKLDDIKSALDDPYGINADLIYDILNTSCNTTRLPDMFNRVAFEKQLDALYQSLCVQSNEIMDYSAYVETLRYKAGYSAIYNNEAYYKEL